MKAGDRVTLHMPMIPELPITMLACARLGVIHSQVFGGFSGRACADRIVDSGSQVSDHHGCLLPQRHAARSQAKCRHRRDLAAKDGQKVNKVLVWQRYPGKASAPTPMVDGRDYFVNDLLKDYYGVRVDPVPMPAEAPLFLMYTSGTTGKPKGCQHSTGGYLAYVAGTSKYVQDIHPEDVYWCMADIGWITGHSYIVYGPLSLLRLHGDLRRRAHLSGCGTPLAHRPGPGCQHLPHRTHRHSGPAQNRPRRTRQIQLPLQTHDHRGRTHRARSVEMVL